VVAPRHVILLLLGVTVFGIIGLVDDVDGCHADLALGVQRG
jgi:hypothetical protein